MSYRYLPSKQFSFIVISFLLSVGLVFAADRITAKSNTANSVNVAATPALATDTSDWQASLDTVQAASGTSLPAAPDQTTVDGLLKAAQSSNVTDTISRTLLVNLSDAQAQGLGNDIPTQDQIIQSAMSQISPLTPAKQYTSNDLQVIPNSSAALHTYGNAVAAVINGDSSTNAYAQTLTAIDTATAQNDATALKNLSSVQTQYEKVAADLAATPVPQTMEPFQLELVQDFTKIAATYPLIQTLVSDPVQGLSAVQQYNTLTQDVQQMFINIAQQLNKNGILFTKDEQGASWAILLQIQQ